MSVILQKNSCIITCKMPWHFIRLKRLLDFFLLTLTFSSDFPTISTVFFICTINYSYPNIWHISFSYMKPTYSTIIMTCPFIFITIITFLSTHFSPFSYLGLNRDSYRVLISVLVPQYKFSQYIFFRLIPTLLFYKYK